MMPQIFQVLRCFKCFVFQVHQTKKSNKWDCKLCGEKQSIKRHYGLGTGKECRLHVQKLNSIRGEVDEINNKIELNNSGDEEISKNKIFPSKQANVTSKWYEYVDKTEDVIVPESEFVGNAEVVLEIPAKHRKFQKPKTTKIPPVKFVSNTFSKPDYFDNIPKFQTEIPEVHESLLLPDVANTNNTKEEEVSMRKQTNCFKPNPDIKKFIPHGIDKSSKWAQFAGDDDSYNSDPGSNDDDNDKNFTIANNFGVSNKGNVKITKGLSDESTHKTMVNNIFSQFNEADLDDVLDI